MNLKEAFRYQNKLQNLMDEAEAILNRDRNVTKVENTALRHKVHSEAEDETTVEKPDTEYAHRHFILTRSKKKWVRWLGMGIVDCALVALWVITTDLLVTLFVH